MNDAELQRRLARLEAQFPGVCAAIAAERLEVVTSETAVQTARKLDAVEAMMRFQPKQKRRVRGQ